MHQYNYDVWGNLTQRLGWGGNYGAHVNETFAYNRNRRIDFQYDLAGQSLA
jgi:hypothetical protein